MSLKLYYHPLASYCWKPLIALYENGTPFEPVLVDLMDEVSAAAFRAVWALGKFPVLRDEERDRTIAESTVVIEYLDAFYPGPVRLLPADADRAWQARMWDRFHDFYVQTPMAKIVLDSLRPEGSRDPFGVEQAHGDIGKAYDVLEPVLKTRTWMTGDDFTLADCAAAPALLYADTIVPIGETHPNLRDYLDRLIARPSFARVLAEAEPYFSYFPLERKPRIGRARPEAGG